MGLVVIETHPVQYHAPVYRLLQQDFGIPTVAIYGSDFSIQGYSDPEFKARFAWDTDLTSGYQSVFLSRVSSGGAENDREVTTRGLRRLLRQQRPEAILLLGYSPRFYQLTCIHALVHGTPLLFRGETTDHARSRSRVKQAIRDVLLSLLYRRCDRLLYIGKRSRQHFLRLGCHESKLVFSPYCVDTSPFQLDDQQRNELRASARVELGVSKEDIVVVFAGKLSVRKGPDLLIESIRRLPDALRDRTMVLFVGEGDLREQLQTSACAGPRVRAFFAGFQNQRQLSRWYHAGDLMALPSRCSETWGLVVNEALHHGLPCVVSDAVGCAPDLVTDQTGAIATAGSADGLSMALQHAFSLCRLAGTRSACRAKAEQFSIRRAAEGISRAFHDVLAKSQWN
jgi:glycosyltransferase involved in cell wall biosynthesis